MADNLRISHITGWQMKELKDKNEKDAPERDYCLYFSKINWKEGKNNSYNSPFWENDSARYSVGRLKQIVAAHVLFRKPLYARGFEIASQHGGSDEMWLNKNWFLENRPSLWYFSDRDRIMRTTTPQHLSELQKNPKNVRNICILAHVDHGKY